MTISRNVRLWAAAATIGALLAGCETSKHAVEPPPAKPIDSALLPGTATPEQSLLSQPPALAPDSNNSAQTVTPPDAKPPAKEAHPVPPDKKVETASDSKPPASKPGTSEIESYNAKKPALMGIRLTDTRSGVTQKFGEPVSEYVMEDERDPISVVEYEGFAVGFNAGKTVEFIEITSKDVNPGLNGLRLGQKVKDAETALGKPDTNTNFALHYKAGGTILKLDVDPKTETIQSIKLFADAK
ncbi:DUF4309 domain-containing protein [Paenibacillus flagellatus]|uniref:DUF4309 domain-containing protein n=1 Tax=Paenibacillus flagellatus TaxID=2211139 RepID=A0A2V5KW63_9BACL|nr:DUF4309 domain-containing protein [Paenibacillus flagellatus]PYI56497.1 DUF4309 domain-containing protein [Paenibacillus flagellatus]